MTFIFQHFRSKHKEKDGDGEYESRWAYLSRYLVRISKRSTDKIPVNGIRRSFGGVVVGIPGLIMVGRTPIVVSVVATTRNKK